MHQAIEIGDVNYGENTGKITLTVKSEVRQIGHSGPCTMRMDFRLQFDLK